MGRATELLQMPTRMLMAGGAKRRRAVIGIVAALVVAAGVGTGGAVFALESAKVGQLHQEWGAFQGCMLGEALAPDELAAHRYRLLLLAQTATPPEKRVANKGQVWPASCLSSLAVVSENATRAPAAGDDLAKASAAVVKALTTGTLQESPKTLDALWKSAAASKLTDRASGADPSTPKAVKPLLTRAAFESQARPFGDFALAGIRSESSPSARLRFFVDDRSTPTGPRLCQDQPNAPGSLTCSALGPDVAKLSPGLRLFGKTPDGGTLPLLLAGERGRGGVFGNLANVIVQGPTVLGATALEGGRVRVLVKKDGNLVLVEGNGAKDKATETVLHGMSDAALVSDYVVSRNPTNALVVQRLGVTDPSVEVGELPEALSNDKESDERATLCRAPGTEALRLRGAQNDFLSLNVGGRWSPPQKLARTEQLSCADGVAVLATTTHNEMADRVRVVVRVDRCAATGCRETRLSHYDMLSGVAELLPTSRASVATAVAGNRMYFAWFTSLGDLRVRSGTIDNIATASDVVVYEGSDTQDAAPIREVALVPSTQGAVLLARTSDGVRVFTFDADGAVAPAVTKL